VVQRFYFMWMSRRGTHRTPTLGTRPQQIKLQKYASFRAAYEPLANSLCNNHRQSKLANPCVVLAARYHLSPTERPMKQFCHKRPRKSPVQIFICRFGGAFLTNADR
jgi:hypothetical protein